MTERWRTKLGDLDKVGPGEDVYQRAKAGPTHVDEPVPEPKTSTRVITAVVAFAVFALAIGLFAIPALRTHTTPADSASANVVALWPVQTSDQMQKLQQDADAGAADWSLDPQAIATKFGQEVMGWPDAVATRNFDPYCFDPASGGSGAPVPCGQLPVGGWSVPAGVPPSVDSPSDVPDLGTVRAYAVFPCDPKSCDLSQPPEWVQLYQPLEQGQGGVWAVLQAVGSPSLSVSPFQVVHEGATVSTSVLLDAGLHGTLAYGSCAVSAGTSDPTQVSGDGTGVQIETEVHLGTSCSGSQPGYVWAATADRSLVDGGSVEDPFNGGQPVLTSLTAVPVMMVSGSSSSEAPVSATPSPSSEATAWISYTDPMGFSLKMPSDWQKTSIQDELILNPPDGEPYIQINHVPNDGFHDDSSFPLDYASMASDPQPHFYGDGQAFIIQWFTRDARPPTDQEAAIFDRITRSISFEPWDPGETRHGWTAVWDGSTTFPKTWPWWVSANDNFWFATESAGKHLVYGPVYMCNGASLYTGSDSARITCANNAHGQWDTSGQPASDNTIGFDTPLKSYPAVVSWDGHLLVRFP